MVSLPPRVESRNRNAMLRALRLHAGGSLAGLVSHAHRGNSNNLRAQSPYSLDDFIMHLYIYIYTYIYIYVYMYYIHVHICMYI